jgi:hypothetical protein
MEIDIAISWIVESSTLGISIKKKSWLYSLRDILFHYYLQSYGILTINSLFIGFNFIFL